MTVAIENRHAFEALPKEKRQKFLYCKTKASEAFHKQKFSTCLLYTFEAEAIFKLDYEIYFWRGLCYALSHDYKNAVLQYKKVISNYPDDFTTNANLYEIYFFSGDYTNSLIISDRMRTFYGQERFPKDSIPLLEFKRLVSLVKLSKKHPELNKEVEKLMVVYNYMDDTPYSYYAEALAYYNAGDIDKGYERLENITYIFNEKDLLEWDKVMEDADYLEDYSLQELFKYASSKREEN